MSIYNLSYDQKAVELLPPDKRAPKQLAWVKAMFGQLKYLRDAIFTYYKSGITIYNDQYVVPYDPGAWPGGYSIDFPVKYGEAIYVSLKNNNTSAPTSADWELIQSSFIGVDDRVKFNANKLVLEYALNLRFEGVFRQPPGYSDLYIVKNSLPVLPFIVGADEGNSSVVLNGQTDSIINDYSFGTFYNFTIMVKGSVISPLGPNYQIQIRNFVDQYNTIGLSYDIQLY